MDARPARAGWIPSLRQKNAPSLLAARLYVSPSLLIALSLTELVIRQRMVKRVLLGTGHDHDLEKVVHAHGSFAENAPFLLVGLVVLALIGFPPLVVHMLGLAMLVVRAAHAYAFATHGGVSPARTMASSGHSRSTLSWPSALSAPISGWSDRPREGRESFGQSPIDVPLVGHHQVRRPLQPFPAPKVEFRGLPRRRPRKIDFALLA